MVSIIGKQSLFVITRIRDVDADGVAFAVERACESIAAMSQRSPRCGNHVEVGLKVNLLVIIISPMFYEVG